MLCYSKISTLSKLLRNDFGEIKTSATKSVPSLTANLFQKSFNFNNLCNIINDQYQLIHNDKRSNNNLEIKEIDPLKYASVPNKIKELKDWDWVYGKSPKFSVSKSLTLKNGSICHLVLTIKKGFIVDIKVNQMPNTKEMSNVYFFYKLVGLRLNRNELLATLSNAVDDDMEKMYYCKQILGFSDSDGITRNSKINMY